MDVTAPMRTAHSGLADEIDAALNTEGVQAIQPTGLAVPYDINQAAMRFPEFDEQDPEAWFTMIEAFFVHANVRTQKNQFYQVLARLPKHVLRVMNVNLTTVDMAHAYSNLKEELLQVYGTSDEVRVSRLLNLRALGTTHPLQLLAEVMAAIPSDHQDCTGCNRVLPPCPFAYGQFRLRLPVKVKNELPLKPASWQEVRLAVRSAWDKHCGLGQPATVSAATSRRQEDKADNFSDDDAESRHENANFVNARSKRRTDQRSQANSRYCFYHGRFGERARSCEPGCQYKSTRGNHKASKPNYASGNGAAGRK